eukprot:369550-Prymnesium_polylepis.1
MRVRTWAADCARAHVGRRLCACARGPPTVRRGAVGERIRCLRLQDSGGGQRGREGGRGETRRVRMVCVPRRRRPDYVLAV